MTKKEMIYEGKGKKMWSVAENSDLLIAEFKDDVKMDKEALQQAAKKHGLNFNFDDEGKISNYSTELTKLYDQLHAAEVKMNGMSTKEAQDKFKESTITPIEDKIEEIKTVCWVCDKKATMVLRVLDGKPVYSGEQVLIGGNDNYIPVCRKCYGNPNMESIEKNSKGEK